MSISNTSGARGSKDQLCLKFYYVQNWEIRFTLGLNAAKNTHFMKKNFEQKLFANEFRTKKSRSACVYLPHKWS